MRSRISLFLIVILVLGAGGLILSTLPSVHAYSTSPIYPTDDANVWRFFNSTNYGYNPTSYIGNFSWGVPLDESIGYFKFDFTDFDPTLKAGESVQFVGLSLEVFAHNDYEWRDESNFFSLGYSGNQTWNELNLTWLDRPSITETNEVVEVFTDNQYFAWDLSEIQNEIESCIESNLNLTLIVYPFGDTRGFSARMREYGGISYDPRVTLDFNIVSGTGIIYEREPSLASFPIALGQALHIGDLGGRILASIIVLMMFLLPTAFAVSKMKNGQEIVVVAVIIMCEALLMVRTIIQIGR